MNVNNQDVEYFVNLQKEIKLSVLPNYMGCKIPVESNLNLLFIRSMLVDYDDKTLCELLEFGFPIGYSGENLNNKKTRNHSGARDYLEFISKYLQKELEYKAIVGPLKVNPFVYSNLVLSPLNSVPKSTPGERRVILDLSFPSDSCINKGIVKDVYLGEPVCLKYPYVDESGRSGALKSDSTHHFFRNACTKSGSLQFSQFSGC